MRTPVPVTRRPVTALGILLAMLGTPVFLRLSRLDVGEAGSLPVYLVREGVVFLMLGALLLLIRKGERLPLASIGWHTDRLGRSALWGLLGVAPCAVVLACSTTVRDRPASSSHSRRVWS